MIKEYKWNSSKKRGIKFSLKLHLAILSSILFSEYIGLLPKIPSPKNIAYIESFKEDEPYELEFLVQTYKPPEINLKPEPVEVPEPKKPEIDFRQIAKINLETIIENADISEKQKQELKKEYVDVFGKSQTDLLKILKELSAKAGNYSPKTIEDTQKIAEKVYQIKTQENESYIPKNKVDNISKLTDFDSAIPYFILEDNLFKTYYVDKAGNYCLIQEKPKSEMTWDERIALISSQIMNQVGLKKLLITSLKGAEQELDRRKDKKYKEMGKQLPE